VLTVQDELKLKLLATAIVNKLPGTVKLSELMRSETGSDWPSHRAVEHVMVDLKKIGIKDQNADSTDVKRKPGGDTPRKKQKLEGNGGIKKSSPKMKRKRSAHEKDESI